MLGKRIKAHRIRLGLTQAQLAEVLGVSRGAVAKWEAHAPPSEKMICEMAREFDVQPCTLRYGCELHPAKEEGPDSDIANTDKELMELIFKRLLPMLHGKNITTDEIAKQLVDVYFAAWELRDAGLNPFLMLKSD